jgi:hypothetical protein
MNPVRKADKDINRSVAQRPQELPGMRDWEKCRMYELEDKTETMHGSRGFYGDEEKYGELFNEPMD